MMLLIFDWLTVVQCINRVLGGYLGELLLCREYSWAYSWGCRWQ